MLRIIEMCHSCGALDVCQNGVCDTCAEHEREAEALDEAERAEEEANNSQFGVGA